MRAPLISRARRRLPWLARGESAVASGEAVTIRHAFPDDGLALLRLAALDSAEPLVQPVLVAEVDGELRAALSLRDGGLVADPFRHTQTLVELLLARALQLAAADRPRADARTRHPLGRAGRARLRGNA